MRNFFVLVVTVFVLFISCKKAITSDIVEDRKVSFKEEESSEEEWTEKVELPGLRRYFDVLPEPIGFIHPDEITVVERKAPDTLLSTFHYSKAFYKDLIEANTFKLNNIQYQDSVVYSVYFLKEYIGINLFLDAVPLNVREESVFYVKGNENNLKRRVIPIRTNKRKYDLKSEYFSRVSEKETGFTAFVRTFETLIKHRDSQEINWYSVFKSNKELLYLLIDKRDEKQLYFSLNKLVHSYNDLSDNPYGTSELYYALLVEEYAAVYPTFQDKNMQKPEGHNNSMIPLEFNNKELRKVKDIINDSFDSSLIYCFVDDHDYFLKRHNPDWYYSFWIRRAMEGHDEEIYQIVLEILNDYETSELKRLWADRLREF